MHKQFFKQVGAIMVVALMFALAFAPTGLVFAQQPHTVEGLRAQIEALQRQLLILQLQAQIAELQRQIAALRGERPLPTPPIVTPVPTPTPHVDRSLGFWSIERAAQPSAFPGVGRERSVVVLRDEASWNRFWADSRPGIGPVPAAPRVDFPREMVVAAFMGVQSTGGHSIEVTGIIERENVVEVLVRERSPGPGDVVTQALTLPRHVVATIQSHKPVTILVDRAAPPSQMHTLTVTTTGSGTVVSQPSGINCPVDCVQTYLRDTPVFIEAIPATGWTFAGWGGRCSGLSSTCIFGMFADVTVTATFTPATPRPTPRITPAPIPTPSITVTHPNGGETWQVGREHEFGWRSTGALGRIETLLIDHRTGEERRIGAIYGADVVARMSWRVFADIRPGTNVFSILIREEGGRGIRDTSDRPFSIVAPAPTPTP